MPCVYNNAHVATQVEFFVPSEFEAVSWEIAVNGAAARPARALALQQQQAKKQQGSDSHAQGQEKRPSWAKRMGAAVSGSPSLAPQGQSEEVKEEAADARSIFLQTQREQAKRAVAPSELALVQPKELAATNTSLRSQLKAAKTGSRSRSKQPKDINGAPKAASDAKDTQPKPTGYPQMPVPNQPSEKTVMSLREQMKAAKSNSRSCPAKKVDSGGALASASAPAANGDQGETSLSRSIKLRQAKAESSGKAASSTPSTSSAESATEASADSTMSSSGGGGSSSNKDVAAEVAASLRTVRSLVRQANFGVDRANRRLGGGDNETSGNGGSSSSSNSSSSGISSSKCALNTKELSVFDRQAAVIARQKALKKYNTAVVEAKRIQALAPRLSFQGCVSLVSFDSSCLS